MALRFIVCWFSILKQKNTPTLFRWICYVTLKLYAASHLKIGWFVTTSRSNNLCLKFTPPNVYLWYGSYLLQQIIYSFSTIFFKRLTKHFTRAYKLLNSLLISLAKPALNLGFYWTDTRTKQGVPRVKTFLMVRHNKYTIINILNVEYICTSSIVMI